MKIFISWSGDRSKEVAEHLKEFIETVIGSPIELFLSSSDIHAGEQWSQRLVEELENTHFGIICLTPENLNNSWLQFEAGALSKAMKNSHVCPYLLDIEKKDVDYPLKQFQAVEANEKGTKNLIQTINTVLSSVNELHHSQNHFIEKRFIKFWPEYQQKLIEASRRDFTPSESKNLGEQFGIPAIINNQRTPNLEWGNDWNKKMAELSEAINRAWEISRINLSMQGNLEQFRIFRLLASIDEEPFKGIKDKLIRECEEQLIRLEKGSVNDKIYYEWLLEETNKCKKSIKAISSMDCEQWMKIDEEKVYYEANRDARIIRNVDVERIFIVNKESLKNKNHREIILKHLIDGIRIYIVPQGKNNPMGLCIFDDDIIFIDEKLPPNGAGGKLIKNKNNELKEIMNEYNRLKPNERLIESIYRLSKVINVDVKILLDESCQIINDIRCKEANKPDEYKEYYHIVWEKFSKELNNEGNLNGQ